MIRSLTARGERRRDGFRKIVRLQNLGHAVAISETILHPRYELGHRVFPLRRGELFDDLGPRLFKRLARLSGAILDVENMPGAAGPARGGCPRCMRAERKRSDLRGLDLGQSTLWHPR